MSILSDRELRKLGNKIIFPFSDKLVRKDGKGNGVLSYGLSSYGYDVRLHEELLTLCQNDVGRSFVVDPKTLGSEEEAFASMKCHGFTSGKRYVELRPRGFALGRTVERVRVPRDCLALLTCKSSYARCGLSLNTTVMEPEWEGTITLELTNATPWPMRLWIDEGIGQLVFLRASKSCKRSYKDRGGKYMGQVGVTLPRV